MNTFRIVVYVFLIAFAHCIHAQSICDSVDVSPDTVYLSQVTDSTVTMALTFTGSGDISYSTVSFVFTDTTQIVIHDISVTNGISGPFAFTSTFDIIYNNTNVPPNTTVNSLFNVYHDGIPSPTIDCDLPVVFVINPQVGLEKYQSKSGVLVYPNPFGDELRVETTSTPQWKEGVRLLDVEGKLVCEGDLNGGKSFINTGGLPGGVYFLLIREGEFVEIVKVLRE